ncbi:MAG: hypothetical protein V1922_01805 [bacterium]
MRQYVHFQPQLSQFTELFPSIERLAREPFDLMRIYGKYRSYVNRLTHLTDTDLYLLRELEKEHPYHRGAFHFIQQLGHDRLNKNENSPGLKALLDQAIHPDEPTYQEATSELVTMMKAAETLTSNPHDAPGTENMIYGYKVIKDKPADEFHHKRYAENITHFVLCHFMERALFRKIKPANPDILWKKDDFLGALGDIIMIVDEEKRELGDQHYNTPEFRIWASAKEDGGLGWIPFKYTYTIFNAMDKIRWNKI